MARWGITLIVIGLGSLVLPLIHIQFIIMSLFRPYQPFAGVIVALIGVGMVVAASTRSRA
jgi:hypothetical protein